MLTRDPVQQTEGQLRESWQQHTIFLLRECLGQGARLKGPDEVNWLCYELGSSQASLVEDYNVTLDANALIQTFSPAAYNSELLVGWSLWPLE